MPIVPNHRVMVSDAAYIWAAQETIRMHAEAASPHRVTGRCKQCDDSGGCELLRWAERVLTPVGTWPRNAS